MQIPTLTLGAVIALASTFSLSAQQLVKNGDFETGDLSGWTETGWTLASRVSQHDCSGAGASFTFNCEHGGKTGQTKLPNGYWPGNAIEQDILLIQGVEYLFSADVQVQNIQSPATANADAGMVEVFVDSVSVGSYNFLNYIANDDKRARMCFTFKAPSTGQKSLKIEFSRKYYSSVRTPTAFIDNIEVVLGPVRPIICPRNERVIGTNVSVDFEGTPSARFALFVGTGKLASGIKIGNFAGAWMLDGGIAQVFLDVFDAAGLYTLTAGVPNDPGLVGLLLHYQAIEAAKTVSIGEETSWAFYK